MDEEEHKISSEELAGVIGISIGLLGFGLFNMALVLGVSFFMITKLSKEYVFKLERLKKVKRHSELLLILLIACFIIDTLLTYFAVHYMLIAEEYNPVVNSLWATFGFFLGELIRYSVLALTFFVIDYQIKTDNLKKVGVSFLLCLFLFICWCLVITNNIYQLWGYFY